MPTLVVVADRVQEHVRLFNEAVTSHDWTAFLAALDVTFDQLSHTSVTAEGPWELRYDAEFTRPPQAKLLVRGSVRAGL